MTIDEIRERLVGCVLAQQERYAHYKLEVRDIEPTGELFYYWVSNRRYSVRMNIKALELLAERGSYAICEDEREPTRITLLVYVAKRKGGEIEYRKLSDARAEEVWDFVGTLREQEMYIDKMKERRWMLDKILTKPIHG